MHDCTMSEVLDLSASHTIRKHNIAPTARWRHEQRQYFTQRVRRADTAFVLQLQGENGEAKEEKQPRSLSGAAKLGPRPSASGRPYNRAILAPRACTSARSTSARDMVCYSSRRLRTRAPHRPDKTRTIWHFVRSRAVRKCSAQQGIVFSNPSTRDIMQSRVHARKFSWSVVAL
eukprot:COSAG03_NODE_5617_length_1208_cov_1.882777_2_plen_174_part_00